MQTSTSKVTWVQLHNLVREHGIERGLATIDPLQIQDPTLRIMVRTVKYASEALTIHLEMLAAEAEAKKKD